MRYSPRLGFAQRRLDGQGGGRLAAAQRRLRARELASNRQLEKRYESALVGVVRALHQDVYAAIAPKLAQYAKPEEPPHADAMNPFSGDIDGILVKHIESAPRVVSPLFARHAQDVADSNAKALRVVGIRPSDLRLGPVIATKRDENIRLIDKAMRAYADDVRALFNEPATFGMRVEDIQAKLLERGNVSESRAELIARDQTLKLNAAITKTRQENVGITKYTWSTSLDERVREEHRVLEGQTFDWSSPPPVGHPGEDFQCRCVAVPVIDGLGDLESQLVGAPDPVEAPAAPEPAPVPAIEVGTHVRAVDSSLSAADTRDILSTLADDQTRALLAQPGQEVDTIFMRERGITIDGVRVDGSYTYRGKRIELATTRPPSEINQPWVPGKTFKLSAAASSVREAVKIDLRHELGHHVHGGIDAVSRGPAPVLSEVTAAYQRARAAGVFITEYAGYNAQEYFAESFAAFFHKRDDLRHHDPNGFAMVERVLQLRGVQSR